MKNTTIFITFLLFSTQVIGQKKHIPISTYCSAGGNGQVTSNSYIDWTLGETIIGYGETQTSKITNGQQQDSIKIIGGINPFTFSLIKVYPNPANGILNLTGLGFGNKEISILEITGKVIKTIHSENDSELITTDFLSSGMYLLKLTTNNNQQIVIKITINNN